MSVFANIYWRRIKDGARKFDATPTDLQADVKTLARADVGSGNLSSARYREIIGEDYAEEKTDA